MKFYIPIAGSLLIILSTLSCADPSKKDLTFTPQEYRKLNMPDDAKTWSKEQYGQALNSMRNIKLYNPLSLPKKHSLKSSGYFNRLISEDNLSFMQDSTIPLSDKAYQVQHYSGFQTGLIHLYSDAIQDEKYYAEELIDIYIFGLFIKNSMLDLAEKISSSDNELTRKMSAASSFVSQEYAILMFRILEEQVKSNKYPAGELVRLSGKVSQSITGNWKWIEPSGRVKLKTMIQAVIEKSTSDTIINNYRKIQAETRDSVVN